jgi:hypothetical protein
LKTLPRQEVVNTYGCSGSNGLPLFTNAIGYAWRRADFPETPSRHSAAISPDCKDTGPHLCQQDAQTGDRLLWLAGG